MATYFFTNSGTGYFTDSLAGLLPGQTVEIEKGKETKTMDAAFHGGWLSRSENKPDNAKMVPLLAVKPVTEINAKPKK